MNIANYNSISSNQFNGPSHNVANWVRDWIEYNFLFCVVTMFLMNPLSSRLILIRVNIDI